MVFQENVKNNLDTDRFVAEARKQAVKVISVYYENVSMKNATF